MSVGGPVGRALVGRERELATLRAALRTGGAVVVRGPAGVGKSRLVRELVAAAEAAAGTVLVGRSTAAARATPLRPIREALLGAARRGLAPGRELEPYRPTLAAVVPDWQDGAAEPPEEWMALLGEAVLRLLIQLGDTPVALLVVEDLQWADPETCAVVEYLADNLAGAPVLLVLTVRDEDTDGGTAGHVLAADLVRRRAASEVLVGPLDRDGVLAMAHAALDGEVVPAELEDAVVSRSEGVPLLVEELLAAAAASGWEAVAAAVPGSVLASVEPRLDELAADGRRLLVVAALLGRYFDWRLAAAAADVRHERAAELLGIAVRANLLDVDGAGFRFHHALTCDAVRAATPPAELELLARRVLDVVDDGSDEVERCLLGVELATRAGETFRAGELLLRAARRSMGAAALTSAAGFAAQARTLTGDDDHRADRLLVEISVLRGDTSTAVSLGEALLRRVVDPDLLADVHLLVGEAELAAGRHDGAARHATHVLALEPDDSRRARAAALAAQAAMGVEDHDAATTRANEALGLAEAVGDAAVQCEALEVIGRVARGSDLDAAERAFQRAYEVAETASLPVWRVRALHELGTVDLFDTLRLDRLQAAHALASEMGALATVAMVDLQLAAAHNERGESTDAIAAARHCAELSATLGLSTLAMGHAVEAMAHARRGDEPAMRQALEAAVATGQDPDHVAASVWGNTLPILHLVRGDLAQAAAELDRAMEEIRRRPTTTFPFPGLWALVRTLLDDGGDAARAEVAALPADTPVSRRTLGGAEAVALGRDGDGAAATDRFLDVDARLDFEGGQFRRAFLRLLVAPAAHADGWGTPEPWLREALARFELLGLDALAGRCRRELRDLGVAVPRRSAVAESSVPPSLAALGVTAREVDVLRLAATGASSREVAEALFISPRTVDKHVERLVQKTGVPRAGFAELLEGAGELRT